MISHFSDSGQWVSHTLSARHCCRHRSERITSLQGTQRISSWLKPHSTSSFRLMSSTRLSRSMTIRPTGNSSKSAGSTTGASNNPSTCG